MAAIGSEAAGRRTRSRAVRSRSCSCRADAFCMRSDGVLLQAELDGELDRAAVHRAGAWKPVRPACVEDGRHHRSPEVVPWNGRLAGQHLVQDDPQGEDVRAVIHAASGSRARATCRGRCPSTSPSSVSCGDGARSRVDEPFDAVARRTSPGLSTSFARPKSSTFTWPDEVTITLSGLRSRWVMPLLVRDRHGLGELLGDAEELP